MAQTYQQYVQGWVDDYLDLYNFAAQLGDTHWQQEIMHTLKNKDQHVQSLLQQQLWQLFDSVNRKMLELFEQMRATQNQAEKETIREQVWELKLIRVEIVRKINAQDYYAAGI
ncbi:hypothetical protein B5M42_005740 [Paenibacillus athensensis]|uniref:Uncharacterized protein n=1 Tax=Paenibacillus athensensis TaxID=1967502 RepID=A0A4Y8Q3G6_9BACL|nr:hypothetical protein [Paenibacillus athensensis]MCD1258344.1 hypothetical protein [Paenibacillus athensensis]